jgi:histidine ammonia-lyase
VADQVTTILGIELAAAAQGIDLLRPLRSSEPLEALHAAVRAEIAPWETDRVMAPDLETAERLLRRELDDHWTRLR